MIAVLKIQSAHQKVLSVRSKGAFHFGQGLNSPRKSPAASFRIRVPGQIRLVGADGVHAHDREIA